MSQRDTSVGSPTLKVKSLCAAKQRLSFGSVTEQEKSEKKKQSKKLRVTVLNPVEIQWPNVSEETTRSILVRLEKLLADMKPFKAKVPLKLIRTVEKKERSNFRRQWIRSNCDASGFSFDKYSHLRSKLAFGVNCVSKGLENDLLSSIILEKEVKPAIITRLLIPLANSKNVPIIAVSGLRACVNKALKIKCIALGFKKQCDQPTDYFYPFSELVKRSLPKS